MRRVFILLLTVSVLSSCADPNRPSFKYDIAKSTELESRGNAMVTVEPDVVKVKLPAQAFQLRGPNMPSGQRKVSVSFIDQKFETIIYALAKDFGVNIVFDTRATKADDIKDMNAQIMQINQARLAAAQSSQTALAQSLPPVTAPQTRQPENTQQNVLQQQNTVSTGDGTKRFEREDREVFDRVTINFQGSVADLFGRLSEISGLFFNEQHGVITCRRMETFSVTLPNYPQLLKNIQDNVSALGGEDSAFDPLSSSLTFKANYRGYVRVKEYLEKVRDNAALVTMRVVLLSVTLKDSHNLGVDWSKVQGTVGFSNPSASIASLTGQQNINSALGAAGASTQGGFNLVFQGANFSVQGFVGVLDEFGTTDIVQNLFVEALSGTTGKVEVVTETPYVKEIGIAALSNNTATTQTTTKTDVVKSGAEIEIKPLYNAKDKSLVLELDAKISEFLRFIELPAGNLGTLQQPEVSRKNIKTSLRLATTQVAVIGGLIYSKFDNNNKGMLPHMDTLLNRNKQGNKRQEELVMIVKPTVIEFES